MTDAIRPWDLAEEVEALQAELDAERAWRFTAEAERNEARADLETRNREIETLVAELYEAQRQTRLMARILQKQRSR